MPDIKVAANHAMKDEVNKYKREIRIEYHYCILDPGQEGCRTGKYKECTGEEDTIDPQCIYFRQREA